MARRNHRSERRDANVISRSPRHVQRQYHYLGTDLHFRPSPRPSRHSLSLRRPDIADNRFWHPTGGLRDVMRYDGTPARINRLHDAPRRLEQATHAILRSKSGVVQAKKALQKRVVQINRFGPDVDRQTRAIRAFSDPVHTPLCRARGVRREVIHAIGRAGSRVAKPRRTPSSEIKC